MLTRLPPLTLIRRFQTDTGIATAQVATLAHKHADFDTHVYLMHSVVEVIKDRVNGRGHAWAIVLTHGIEDTPLWVEIAVPIVEEMRRKGVTEPWKQITQLGIFRTCRKWDIPLPPRAALLKR